MLTEAAGRKEAKLEAPYAAGLVKVCAEVGSTVKCSDPAIKVKLDLTQLGTSDLCYLKTYDSRHNNGDYHYGTLAAINAAAFAAQTFWDDWGKHQTPKARMVINDQSLKWAGLFDLAGTWDNLGDHKSHRQGKNVDFPFWSWKGTSDSGWGETTYRVPMSQAVKDDLEQNLRDQFRTVALEGDHFHFTK